MRYLLLFSLVNFSYADELITQKYCYPSTLTRNSAKQKFEVFKVASDTINIDENCLVIHMKPHREELISRYFRTQIPHSVLSFSSSEVPTTACHLNIEKISLLNEEQNKIQLDRSPHFSKNVARGSSDQKMSIQTLKDFTLKYNQEEIKGECLYLTNDRYKIKITISKHPRPIVPANLPPNTVVYLNNPPADEKTSTLETQIDLIKGQKIEIGSITRNLRGDQDRVSISPNIKLNKNESKVEEKIYLSIK